MFHGLTAFWQEDSIMSIQIDRQKLKDGLKEEFGTQYLAENAFAYADDMLGVAEAWINSDEWKNDPEIDTSREARIVLRQHISLKLPQERFQSWFVGHYMWYFIVRKVTVWSVMKIIQQHWNEMAAEKGLPPED